MIGIRKPSLHYYSRQIVFYEPNTEEGLINLSERLNTDRRENYEDKPDYEYKSLLVVIDEYSTRREQWSKINHQKLGKFGIYNLWRIKKSDLNNYSRQIVFYEPNTEEGLINLSERLNTDRRENYEDQPDYQYKSLLVVIDQYSTRRKQWSKINHQKLGKFGIYNLWRIQKSDLNKYSKFLVKSGYKSDWENRKVEKF